MTSFERASIVAPNFRITLFIYKTYERERDVKIYFLCVLSLSKWVNSENSAVAKCTSDATHQWVPGLNLYILRADLFVHLYVLPFILFMLV